MTSEKNDFAKFLAEIHQLDVRLRTSGFGKSSFSDVTKFQNAGLPMVRNQMEYIYFRGGRAVLGTAMFFF